MVLPLRLGDFLFLSCDFETRILATPIDAMGNDRCKPILLHEHSFVVKGLMEGEDGAGGGGREIISGLISLLFVAFCSETVRAFFFNDIASWEILFNRLLIFSHAGKVRAR